MKKLKAFLSILLASAMIGTAALSAMAQDSVGSETPGEVETPADIETPAELSGIAFIGDSICKMGQWNTLFERDDIDNYGVGGYTTTKVLDKFKNQVEKKYEKLFILCGINDWEFETFGTTYKETLDNFREMISVANSEMAGCDIYIIGLLPTSGKYESFITENQTPTLNKLLKELSDEYKNVTFIDCWDALIDPETGFGDTELSDDGLHPNEYGFDEIAPIIRHYVDGSPLPGQDTDTDTDSDTDTEPAPEYADGDVNFDGTVDVLDLVNVRSHIVGNSTLSETAVKLADMNDDEKLDVLDIVMIRNVIVNS